MIDTHAHLFDKKLASQIDTIINDSKKAGLRAIIVPVTNIETFEESKILLENYTSYTFLAFGVHPTELVFNKQLQQSRSDFDKYLELIVNNTKSNKKLLFGIGETGLDYYWLKKDKTVYQSLRKEIRARVIDLFELEIKLGEEFDLPVIVHLRDLENEYEVYSDALAIISKYPNAKYHFHSFSGDTRFLNQILSFKNTMISFTSNFMHPENEIIRESLISVPIDRLLLETDSPYLPPFPERKYPNTPVNLIQIANQIADLKKMGFKDLEEKTDSNAISFYNLNLS